MLHLTQGNYMTLQEGTVCRGSLRNPDLLRAFATTLERFRPEAAIVKAAREQAKIDDFEKSLYVLSKMFEQLNEIAAEANMYFGTLEGDGADFGFWKESGRS